MDFIDIVIYVSIIFFAIVGYNNGLFKGIIDIVGLIVSLYASFILRSTVSELLMNNLPFLEVGSLLKTATSLNILLYNLLSFILLFGFSELLYNVLLSVFGINEKALALTVKMRFVAKFFGILTGAVEGVIIIFITVFILRQPFVKLNIIDNSKVAKDILKSTPFISDWNRDFINVFESLDELTENETITDANMIEVFINANMINKDGVKKLIELRKIKTDDDIEKVLNGDTKKIKNE